MNEPIDISVSGTEKKAGYEILLSQIDALLRNENNLIARISNSIAAIHHAFNHHWTGCYFVLESQLVLGPFQGPVACMRIEYGKGVCGKSWEQARTIIVNNVEDFPGHIACSPYSKSEIVIPAISAKGNVEFILDIDSMYTSCFDETDAYFLEKIVGMICNS